MQGWHVGEEGFLPRTWGGLRVRGTQRPGGLLDLPVHGQAAEVGLWRLTCRAGLGLRRQRPWTALPRPMGEPLSLLGLFAHP